MSSLSRNIGRWRETKLVADITLVRVDRWLSGPLLEKIMRHNRAVSKVSKYSTNVSLHMKPLARSLLQQINKEMDAQGWRPGEIEIDPPFGHKASREHNSLGSRNTGYGYTFNGRKFFVSVTE